MFEIKLNENVLNHDVMKFILDGSIYGVLIYQNGAPIYKNDMYNEIFDLEINDPKIYFRKELFDLIVPEDRYLLLPDMQKLFFDGKNVHTEHKHNFRIITEKNTQKWIRYIVKPMFSGERVYKIVTIYDITNEKELENEIKVNDAKYNAVLENSGDMFLVIDNNYKVNRISSSFQEISQKVFGEQIVTDMILNSGNNEETNSDAMGFKWFSFIKQALLGDILQFEILIDTETQKRNYNLEFIPIKQNNRVIGVAVIGRDITDLKEKIRKNQSINEFNQTELEDMVKLLEEEIKKREKIERNLRLTKKEIEETSDAKSRFLSNMSHELLTPLNSIIGFSEVLSEGFLGELTVDQKESCDHIHSSGLHLLNLLKNVLEISNMESGIIELTLIETDIFSLIKKSIADHSELINTKNLNFDLDFRSAISKTIMDPKRINQVIDFLIENAIKYSHNDGNIDIIVDAINNNTKLMVTVKDNGVGIGYGDRDKLFKIFEHFETIQNKTYPGVGLGLYYCKKIINLHRGRIWLEADGDKGACFKFTLPLLTGKDEIPL